MKVSKKINRFIIIIILFISCSVISANPVFHIEGAPEHPKIVMASFFSESLNGFRAVTKDFNKKTGIEVEVEGIPYGYYSMWLKSQFLSGTPPEILLTENVGGKIWEQGQSGLLFNFDDDMRQPNPFSSPNSSWSNNFYSYLIGLAKDTNGKLWCIPYSSYSVGFFYNKKIYEKYHLQPPKTFKELVANCAAIKSGGDNAFSAAFSTDDATFDWISDIILNCLLRPQLAQMNQKHGVNFKFDPFDPASTRDERIDLDERIVAFEKGIISPDKSLEYKTAVKIMIEFMKTWSSDCLALTGADIGSRFVKGKSAHYLNGTWAVGEMLNVFEATKVVAPDKYFEFGFFPFPELTAETVGYKLTAGNVNQNTGMRGCLVIPKQKDIWKEKAALLFCQYLTTPAVSKKVFENSKIYDLPAVIDTPGNPKTQALQTDIKYADILPYVSFWGYDNLARSQFETANQMLFDNRYTIEQYLDVLTKNQTESLKRLAVIYSNQLDKEYLIKELGKDGMEKWNIK